MKILIAGTVRQDAPTFALFTRALRGLRRGMPDETDVAFVDDNDDPVTKRLLADIPDVRVLETVNDRSQYVRTEVTHAWTDDLVWRVAANKNRLLRVGREEGYDYVLLLDSDVLLPPRSLSRLIAERKDVLANLFWTAWQPDTKRMPQVWQRDVYEMSAEFIASLETPGVYEVGGLGACTLLSKNALDRGVSFERLHNVSFWGEDRHFCIRAVALGLSLWVDTREPAFHVYRPSDIAEGDVFLKNHDL